MTILDCQTHKIPPFSGCEPFEQISVTSYSRLQRERIKIKWEVLNRTVINGHIGKVKVSDTPIAAHS